MKRNSIGLAILVTLFISNAMADPITGGFGLTLGAKLNVNSTLATNIKLFPETVYHVAPPKPLEGFDEYEVYVTPESHTIYQIKAIRYYNHSVDAKADFEVLEDILRAKYSAPVQRDHRKMSRHQPLPSSDGRESTFHRGDNFSTIYLYAGRKIKKLNPNIRNYDIASRVVITYYSNVVHEKAKEFKDLTATKRKKGQRDTSKLASSGNAVL